MEAHYLWLIAGIGLCIIEMLTGTFFLLVFGIAALAGALVAWLGLGFWAQALAASAVAVTGVLWVQSRRSTQKHMPSFDIGQSVSFERWTSEKEGMARVNYRGTGWDARIPSGLQPEPGSILYIHALDGSIFQLGDKKPDPS